MMSSDHNPPRRILFTASMALGDTVMFLPALRSIREMYPDAEMDIVLQHSVSAKPLERLGYFRNVFDLDNRLFLLERAPGRYALPRKFQFAVRHVWRLVTVLVKTCLRYDMVIGHYNSNLPDLALLTLCSGAAVRVGHVRAGKNRFPYTRMYTRSLPFNEASHCGSNLQDLVAALNGEPVSVDSPFWPLHEDDRLWAQEVLSDWRGENRRVIVVAPSVGQFFWKRWPLERFRELMDRMIRELQCGIVILGGPDDKPDVRCLDEPRNPLIRNLVGKTTVGQSAALLAAADLTVSNDSGAAHLSAAVGTSTVTVFGPTDPVLVAPRGQEEQVLRPTGVPCAPCFRNGDPSAALACGDRVCLKSISVDRVMQAVRQVVCSESGQAPTDRVSRQAPHRVTG